MLRFRTFRLTVIQRIFGRGCAALRTGVDPVVSGWPGGRIEGEGVGPRLQGVAPEPG